MLMTEKKSSRTKKNSALPRKEELTRDALMADVAGLDAAIAELKLFADQIFRQHKELGVDGAQKITRAKLLVQEFSTNLWRAARNKTMRQN